MTCRIRAAAAAVLLTTALSLSVAANRADAITADSADDVCASNADPCNVTDVVDVVSGATLDFGTRSVSVTGDGQFDFGQGSGNILCGSFSAATEGPAINAAGPDDAGSGTDSGTIRIEARRQCDAGAFPLACVDIADCQLGACDTRRCSGKTSRTCSSDSNCQLGTCGLNLRCSASPTFVRCATNADCDLGTCPAQLTCRGKAINPISCSINADCDFGTCSVGSASISLGGALVGTSNDPADVTLRAANSVTVTAQVNLSSRSDDSDGGDFVAEAADGDVTIAARIRARSGRLGQGGKVELDSGQDVIVSAPIDLSGGDFDGGALEIFSGRDVLLGANIRASSRAGAGFGGDVLVDAERDILVNPDSARRIKIATNGHADDEFFAGDGGGQEYDAGHDMTFGSYTQLLANGAPPDAYGGLFYMDVGGDLDLSGQIFEKGRGPNSIGGDLEIAVAGATSVAETAKFDLSSGHDGGYLLIEGGGDVSFAGRADVDGASGGDGGNVDISSDANATVSGALSALGARGGLVLDACRITLADSSRLRLDHSQLTAHESMNLMAGSKLTSVNGANTLTYRTDAKPPVVDGDVSPFPQLVLDGFLTGCPVCGNSEIDEDETCDDGNTQAGDGCDSTCQIE